MGTILSVKSGCKSVVIPLVLAALLIVVMVALSHGGMRYQTDVSGFWASGPTEGASVRLDGTVREMRSTGSWIEVRLCDENACIDAEVPFRFGSRLALQTRVIMSGIYRAQRLHVEDVLTRCHE